MRGYLLAGEEAFLEPYNGGVTGFLEGMVALQATVSDNPPQVELLQETETIIRNWIDQVSEPAIALRGLVNNGQRPLTDIQALVAEKKGKQFFDAMRANMAAFSEVETGLMAQRQAAAAAAEQSAGANLAEMAEINKSVVHTYEVIQTTFLY